MRTKNLGLLLNEIMNKCFEERKRKNLCYKCGKRPPREGKLMCQECADKNRISSKEYRNWITSMGFCYRCKKERIFGDEKICPECLAKASIINKKSVEKRYGNFHNFYLDDIAKIKAKGLCRACRKEKVLEGHTYCAECLAKNNERCRRERAKKSLNRVGIDRSERFSFGLCYLCGEPLDIPDKRLCSSCCEKLGHNFDGHRNKNQVWRKNSQLVFGGFEHG